MQQPQQQLNTRFGKFCLCMQALQRELFDEAEATAGSCYAHVDNECKLF